jgi:DNA polymerase-3 subunit delta
MLSVFYTDDPIILNYEMRKVISKFKRDELKQITFDDNSQNIIDAVLQTNLFVEHQIFLIKNASFLIEANKENESLIECLKHSGTDIYMFLEAKFPKFLKQVDENFILKKLTKFNETQAHQLINDIMNKSNVKFDNSKTQDKFEHLMALDPFLIDSEVNKLILASENNVISAKTIDEIVNNSTELNIFKLTNYLLTNDKNALIKLYDSLILNKYQPVELIPIIANQLITLKLLKMAIVQNYNVTDIENKLGMTKYAQMMNKPLINNLPLSKLNSLIDELYLLDYNIKHNLVNPYQGLKLLLAK